MRGFGKRFLLLALTASMLTGVTGCEKNKKPTKPKTQPTAEVKNGTAEAKGKGVGQSDVPLRIGCGVFDRKFNPFLARSAADQQTVELTQVNLIGCDRTGQMVCEGIDGVQRKYNGTNYIYYGIADIKERYRSKKDITVYRVTIRDDLVFSDGEPITIDDVIFSLYAFCDTDYQGTFAFGEQNIIGLLNYQTDNPKAEEYSEKQVRKYINQMPKKLKKWVDKQDKNAENYEEALLRETRRQLALQKRKKSDKVKSISGITRLNDYELRIRVKGYDKNMLQTLQIPVCPLHYYGDTTKYDYASARFGFTKGDLSSIQANKTSPMGAGAYRFVKYEDGIVYYTANELYYQGCPKIAYLQLKDMKRLAESEDQKSVDAIAEIDGDTIDLVAAAYGQTELEEIRQINSNQKLSGKTITTEFISGSRYGYMRLNADKVKVGNAPSGEESKSLRKALATVFSACRGVQQGTFDNTAVLVNYPVSIDSWLSPEQRQEGNIAFSLNRKGDEIYQSKDSVEKKREAAKKAALEYLAAAGYTVKDGAVTSAPAGAALEYSIWLQGGESNTLYAMVTAAAEDLKEIGINIKTVAITDQKTMQKELKTGKQEIWCGEENISADPNLSERFCQSQSGNSLEASVLTAFEDAEFAKAVRRADESLKAEERVTETAKALDILLDWGVELPVYQNKTSLLMSTRRIDTGAMTKDLTPYYDWMQDIQELEMAED